MPRKVRLDVDPMTGMPEGAAIARPTLLEAVQIARARGADFKGVDIECLREVAHPDFAQYGFVRTDEPNVIRLLNSEQVWEEVHRDRYLRETASWLKFGQVTEEEHRNLVAAVPSTYAVRLAENLDHELAHVQIIRKVGDYLDPRFEMAQALPADLHGRIVSALERTSATVIDNELIGEVIAEDARRAATGKFARISVHTFRADVPDLESAFERARQVQLWLQEPDPK